MHLKSYDIHDINNSVMKKIQNEVLNGMTCLNLTNRSFLIRRESPWIC